MITLPQFGSSPASAVFTAVLLRDCNFSKPETCQISLECRREGQNYADVYASYVDDAIAEYETMPSEETVDAAHVMHRIHPAEKDASNSICQSDLDKETPWKQMAKTFEFANPEEIKEYLGMLVRMFE